MRRASHVFDLRLEWYNVDAYFKAEGAFDKQSAIGCLGTPALMLFLGIVGAAFLKSPRAKDTMFNVIGLVFFFGIFYTIFQLGLSPRRYIRNNILPSLVRALRPLKPSEAEVIECVEMVKKTGVPLGKRITVNDIWKELNRP